MGLNWSGAFSAAFGAGADLLKDSIMRDRNSEDMVKNKTALAALDEQLTAAKNARIAAIGNAVPEEVDDSTHPEGKRKRTEREMATEKAKAYDKAGLIDVAEKYRGESNRLRDDEQRAKEKADELLWRERRADIEDKRATAAEKRNEQLARIQEGNLSRQNKLADIQLNEAKEKEDVRKKVKGLIGAAENVDMSQPGAEASKAFYDKEAERAGRQGDAILRAGKSPDQTEIKSKIEEAKTYRQEMRDASKEAAELRKMGDTVEAQKAEARAAAAKRMAHALFKASGSAIPEDVATPSVVESEDRKRQFKVIR